MSQIMFYEPYPALVDIGRLALKETAAEPEDKVLGRASWEQLKSQVHSLFAEMARQVEHRWPAVSSRAGDTEARSYYLIFRTFYPPSGSHLDPVVVGVTVEARETGLVIWGDIVGEETGEIFYESSGGERHIDCSFDTLLPVAAEIARELAGKRELVAGALDVLAKTGPT